jgi:leucyl-tRNA synthetase
MNDQAHNIDSTSHLAVGGITYNFRDIEARWQQKWIDEQVYKVPNDFGKPKYYVLDMFPYPSGAGLHVGHPLGYIASDIFARYKRLKGYNVLHPMGYDSFGLPAEQYAIEHGVHPAVSTEKNIATFRKQLDNIGFSFDWSREVRTSDPQYYKWTQWIFLQLFKSYFCHTEKKALPISLLIEKYETKGAMPKAGEPVPGKHFTADQWKAFSEKEKADILMRRRLAYCGYGEVNWCEALGTVLANDEVVNGVSERGGHPVIKKRLRQWYLRITEYADRLLQGLETVDFSDAMKEMQSNWIGKSVGAEIEFRIQAPSQPSPLGKEGQHTDPRHYTADPSLYKITKELAERKRKEPTFEEELLWQHLKGNQTGFHIRRQHIIGSYIVDFACIDKMLTIEIDGGYHNDPIIKQYDLNRTRYLEQQGFKEIRFTNKEVKNNILRVLDEIKQHLSDRPSSRKVPPEGGDLEGASLAVYTTRPDTIFGVDFMVIAPEHDLVEEITTEEQKAVVEEYIYYVKSRSERERMAEKTISGAFTGSYAINPFNGKQIPVWISEYVLAGYGTGAIMGVPSGDERDHKFAKHFNIPITNIIGEAYNGEEANPDKNLLFTNSDFLNGLNYEQAFPVVMERLEELGIGKRKVNYKMRDAAFSRQRYWGEPFPIKWIDGIAYPLNESQLPLELPHVESYKPGPEGEGPLANIENWKYKNVKLDKTVESSQVLPAGEDLDGAGSLETNTMPGYAGSSWYFLRYMDPHNQQTFCDKNISTYWNQVDLYVGGTEHAVGHLLYSRMWTKCLYDLGLITFDEPFKRLLNQGMIQGVSKLIFRLDYAAHAHSGSYTGHYYFNYFDDKAKIQVVEFESQSSTGYRLYVSYDVMNHLLESSNWQEQFGTMLRFSPMHVKVDFVDGEKLDIEAFQFSPLSIHKAIFFGKGKYYQDGFWRNLNGHFNERKEQFLVKPDVEKMSKSKLNTVNPDTLVEKYGADTFRMYEMFLGPVEMSKPWDTKGIEGVHRFLKKMWRLFFDEKGMIVNDQKPTADELKVLHKTIKKVEEDTERFSFNTSVSAFMVCVNELTDLKCHKKEILAPLLVLLTPYAPHVSCELWDKIMSSDMSEERRTVLDASYPKWEEKYLAETTKEYPISINGKLRTTLNIDLNASQQEVENIALKNEVVQKWLEGRPPKKIIYVKGKMVNVVV